MKTLTQSFITPRFLLILLLFIRGPIALADDAAPTSQTPPARLVEVGHEKAATGPIVFDMGVLDQMDNKQANEDALIFNWHTITLPGFKHTFSLKNAGTRDITLSRIRSERIGIQTRPLQNDKPIDLPLVLKPGDTIGILVAFDYYLSPPGLVSEPVNLFEGESEQPIATLVMRGQVKGGITFLEKAVDFGKVNAEAKSREFTLIFDKRVPYQMTPSPLQLISSNPFITIESLDEGKTIMGVKVEQAQMIFPMEENLPRELRLRFRAILSDKAPTGPLDGQIKLVMRGAPLAIIVRDVNIPIKGEVVAKR